MTNDPMEHLTPEEALDAFLDGELDLAEEQPLFDHLQASPDLRGNMKDALAIRAAVHKDLIAPPSDGEGALLSAVGLTTGAAAAGSAAAMATSAPGLFGRLLPWLTAGGGAVAGFVIALFLLDGGQGARQDMAQSGGSDGTSAVAGHSSTTPPPAPMITSAPDTVYAVRYITRAVPIQRIEEPESIEPRVTETVTPTETTVPAEAPMTITSVQSDRMGLINASRSTASANDVRPAMHASPGRYTLPVMFRMRTLASGLPANEATPNSVQDAVLPNTAFALMLPFAEGHSIGLEMGTESFRQEFNGMEGDREVRYIQTPVLYWIGATYQWMPMEFAFLPGLAPYLDATMAFAVEQGPVGRGTVGLSYRPVGPLRFNVGLDAAALMYRNEGGWYTSSKWGPSFGLSIDLGAIR